MNKEIKFSLVYRDMWQSSGKYQPRVDQLEKIAPVIVDMGCFDRIETNGGAFEQVNLMYGENPNKAVRAWTKAFNKAGIQTHMLERALNGLRMYGVPADVRRLRLEHYDQQWLDFVVSSRRGEEPWRDYDIIEGGVANDQVIDTVEDYYAGRITAEQAIGQLRFAKPTHQMCIRRQTIVDRCLHFIGTEPVVEKGGAQ